MPRVLSYTPAWLSRSAPGFRLFAKEEESRAQSNGVQQTNVNGSDTARISSQRRVIAHRGSEVFVAVDGTIRWGDLATIKDEWESKALSQALSGRRGASVEDDEGLLEGVTHKVLRMQYVSEPIQQLVPSPNQEFLAIVTAHTIHVCVLPDSSHLEQPDSGPIRPKMHHLGKTTHTISQSPIVSTLWHPLGVNGSCLVTVTEDAVVRLWELNMDSRWSAEEPAVAMDLRKLQYARSSEDDVQPIRIEKNRGYSANAIGMDVASACFGGSGTEEEEGWSAMTLWVAMTEGDVYALCPLLPSKWQPPSTLIPSLTTSVAVKCAYVQEAQTNAMEKDICNNQYSWLAEVDKQDPPLLQGKTEFSPSIPVYSRPNIFSAVPQLQGPFSIVPGDIEDDLDIVDIKVVAPMLDTEDLYQDEDDAEPPRALTSSLVCLLTSSGRAYICLDLDGVQGRWLPLKKPNLRPRTPTDYVPELVVLEALETTQAESTEGHFTQCPMLTAGIHSRYAFFVTNDSGIFYLSVEPLIEQLEKELESRNGAGAPVRIKNIIQGSHTLREQILRFREEDRRRDLSAPAVMQDSDLGYFLLTVCDGLPHAAVLDRPHETVDVYEMDVTGMQETEKESPAEPRPAYQPPEALYQISSLPAFAETQIKPRYKHSMKDEVRLSAATLEIMTDMHRLLSKETLDMGRGVSDLFARCDRMRLELWNQIENVREIVGRVDQINGEDADNFGESKPQGSKKLDVRLQAIKDKHAQQLARFDALKKKLAQAGGRPLSEKEQGWVKEADKLGKSLVKPEEEDEGTPSRARHEYWRRFEEAKELTQELLTQAKEVADDSDEEGEKGSSLRVPPDIRQSKIASVMRLLERESALVDATQQRLERLSLA